MCAMTVFPDLGGVYDPALMISQKFLNATLAVTLGGMNASTHNTARALSPVALILTSSRDPQLLLASLACS
jgi:hypothetical protein